MDGQHFSTAAATDVSDDWLDPHLLTQLSCARSIRASSVSEHVRVPDIEQVDVWSYHHSLELSSIIPWSSDADGAEIQFAERWTSLTGAKSKAAVDDWSNVLHPEEVSAVKQNWETSKKTGQPLDQEHRLRMRDGSYRWYRSRAAAHLDSHDGSVRWYGTSEDIHDRKIAQLNLEWLAHHDDLSGVGNRTLLQKNLSAAIESAVRKGVKLALLLIDIKDFKQINDGFGHAEGDRVLSGFAQRMKLVTPEIYRTGGNEFALLLPELRTLDPIERTVSLVTDALLTPISGNFPHGCEASIGWAVYPEHARSAGELLKSAGIALNESKKPSRENSCAFESDMRDKLQLRSSMLSLARHAVDQNLIVPLYQPKIDLLSGRVGGFEALLRWKHPRLGKQLPATIEQAFDHPELSIALASCMTEAILSDVRRWLSDGIDIGRIAINVASPEFGRTDYADRLLSRLHAYDVPPEHLEIEVTETVFLGANGEAVEGALTTLSEAGLTISLDDFGTGYASLSHLRKFPVHVLKIDRSFIAALSRESSDRAIVKAIVNLAKSLGIETVAEGVEDWEQVNTLRAYGCDKAQGYLFGRAAPAAEVPHILRSGHWRFANQAGAASEDEEPRRRANRPWNPISLSA